MEQAFVFVLAESIGHAGDVVGDDALRADAVHPAYVPRRQQTRFGNVRLEHALDEPAALGVHPDQAGVGVDGVAQQGFEFFEGTLGFGGQVNNATRVSANLVGRGESILFEQGRRGADGIVEQRVLDGVDDRAANGRERARGVRGANGVGVLTP